MSLHPVPAELKVQYYDWGNTSTPLLTTTKAFSTSQMFLLCNFQTRDDNLSAGHLYQYHFGGQISDDKEYSYGQISSPASFCPSPGTTPPTPARETITNYQTVSSPQQNVFEKPSSVIVNGSGSRVAETDYTYDGSSLAGVSAVSHDDTLYSASAQSGRGNLTTSIERCFPSCTDISTQFSYDSTGQVTSITDGLNNITGLAYTDSPSGGNAAGNSNAYLTKVTRPSTNGVNHIAQYQYNYVTGRLATAIDENSQSTTYQYNDPLFRLTDIYAPPSPTTMPHTQYAYTDGTTPSLTATNPIGVQNEVIRDGLGRSTETVVLTDPVSPVYTRTSYYGEGQVYQQWNATRCDPDTVSSCPNETTFGYTSFQYDALGRKKQQTDSDEVSTQTWSYSGPTVTYTDENGNQWKRSTDSLGRLGTVLEPNGTTKTSSMETDYGYDALNNLLSVMQCGALCSSPASNGPISRSFHYDSLSRLYSASNPEAGTTGYTYDANSNLQSKTDARVIKTQFGYDALNRAISKTYPSDTTGTTISCYQYDSSSISGAGGNLIGRLTNAWTQSHSSSSCTSAPTAGSYLTLKSILAYDAMGRPTGAQQQQCIGSKCSAPTPYALGMLYDLAGNQTALTNSAGASGKPLTLTNYFDTASRPCLTTSSWSGTAPLSFPLNLFQTNPSTSASPLGYAPFGGLQNWYMGSSSSTVSTSCGTSPSSPINITQGYTNRLWLNSISATGQIP
jgi:YD repeat-containing protein